MVRFLVLTDSLKLVLSTTYPLVPTKHMALLPMPLPQGLKEGHEISRERRSEGGRGSTCGSAKNGIYIRAVGFAPCTRTVLYFFTCLLRKNCRKLIRIAENAVLLLKVKLLSLFLGLWPKFLICCGNLPAGSPPPPMELPKGSFSTIQKETGRKNKAYINRRYHDIPSHTILDYKVLFYLRC